MDPTLTCLNRNGKKINKRHLSESFGTLARPEKATEDEELTYYAASLLSLPFKAVSPYTTANFVFFTHSNHELFMECVMICFIKFY